MLSFPGTEGMTALRTAVGNPHRKYPDQKDPRYQKALLFPALKPRFSIGQDSSVFTIGSCFARNVEEVLHAKGIAVPTLSFSAPREEGLGRSNRILNQYNPGTMKQCVDAAYDGVPAGGIFDVKEGEVVDTLLSTGSRTVTPERAAERRQQIVDLYRTGLDSSDFVVVTLGLIETWVDKKAGLYLNEMPPRPILNAESDRFEFRPLGVDECEALVSSMVERLNADRKRNVVLTVSPVPLQNTFSPSDAVVANSYSKAVLRVVAERISQNFEVVDYFPSYEIVASGGLSALLDDNVHVSNGVVEDVVNYMLSHYMT